MENLRQSVGRRGEEAACRYLERKGHRILERNWRGSHLEIDIITLNEEGLHIVEVKSRTAPVMAEPQINVGPTKQKRVIKAAKAYLHDGNRSPLPGDLEIFFDIITVVFDGDETTIEYYPQAFIPIYV